MLHAEKLKANILCSSSAYLQDVLTEIIKKIDMYTCECNVKWIYSFVVSMDAPDENLSLAVAR